MAIESSSIASSGTLGATWIRSKAAGTGTHTPVCMLTLLEANTGHQTLNSSCRFPVVKPESVKLFSSCFHEGNQTFPMSSHNNDPFLIQSLDISLFLQSVNKFYNKMPIGCPLIQD